MPGEVVPGGPRPYFTSDTIYPLTNGWEAGDHRSYTAVDAGGDPARPSVGELGIFRQDFVKVTQTQHVVNVPGAGTLRIVKAPLGHAVATWAQQRGDLAFVGSRGDRGGGAADERHDLPVGDAGFADGAANRLGEVDDVCVAARRDADLGGYQSHAEMPARLSCSSQRSNSASSSGSTE